MAYSRARTMGRCIAVYLPINGVVCRNDLLHVDEPCPYRELLARRAAMQPQVTLYMYLYTYLRAYIF